MEHTETRIGIIGFGSLMESLLPCCDSLLQGPREGHIFAVKGSEEGLARKRAQYSFEITAGDPLDMLKRITPQVILFSPPPALAEELTQTVLKHYYDGLRETGAPLPLLICFPPKPLPRFYRQTLGAGISQATLMPCAAQRAGSYDVGRYGYSLISMDGKAMPGQEQLGQLLDFTRPVGTALNVGQDELTAALAGMVTAHNVYELCFTLQNAFSLCGRETSSVQIASQMRFALRQLGTEMPSQDKPGLPPCRREEEMGTLYQKITDLVIRAWYEGLCRFAASQRLDLREFGPFLRGTMDVLLMTVQEESREHLERLSAGCATKGGLLERALEMYPQTVGKPLAQWVAEEAAKEQRDAVGEERSWPLELVERAAEVTQAVFERGERIDEGQRQG